MTPRLSFRLPLCREEAIPEGQGIDPPLQAGPYEDFGKR